MSARLVPCLPIAVLLLASAGWAQDDGSIPLTDDSRLVTRTVAEGDSASGWTATVRLPAIEGPAADEPGWAGLAGHLDEIVAGEREAFHENLAEWEPSDPGWVSTFDVDGYVLEAAPPIVSIVLDFSIYYAGAAHPGHYAITVVWDAGRGRALTTRDLFPATSDWEQVLSREAIPILERDLGDMADSSWIAEGAGPRAENFRRWALVEDGLVLFFDPYQVAPYAAGPQAVTIPRAALAGVAAPDGPLASD
ncbi:MAG TPA: RsiV family protein [Thermoanaerobaculia bacterium]